MEGNARTWFTPKQRAELWERWKSGQCVADIARALERRNKSGVYRVLAINGGIAPSPRRRAPTALKLEEREEISRSQQTIGVLVAAALPRAAWIAEINLHVGGNREALVVGHLLAAIPSQGATQLRRQFAHLL